MSRQKSGAKPPHTSRMPTQLNARDDNKDSYRGQGNSRPMALCHSGGFPADFHRVGVCVAVDNTTEPGTTGVAGVLEGIGVGVRAQSVVAVASASATLGSGLSACASV